MSFFRSDIEVLPQKRVDESELLTRLARLNSLLPQTSNEGEWRQVNVIEQLLLCERSSHTPLLL